MNTKIKELLEEGRVDGVFATKPLHGFPFPWLFTQSDTADLEPWQPNEARYPILKLLLEQARKNPDKKYGILVRGCEERGLKELFKWSQLDPEKVVILGQACSDELAAYCECAKPYPDHMNYGQPASPVTGSRRLTGLNAMESRERLSWWLTHFNRCIRCHGCRDVCPVCFCTECSLEHKDFVPGQKLPPDNSFHMARAIHMGGRCVDCGLCEEVCPARIPLRALYKQVNRLIGEVFSYRPGYDAEKSPFTFLGDEMFLPGGPR